jgi:glutathione S-transferase
VLELIIGNRNYSSWSLRAWLHLRASNIPFTVTRIPLDTDEWRASIGRYSPARLVPVLIDGELAIWDTMAIFEYVLEIHPEAIGWPVGREARARARSICAEMHSGFKAIRDELPQNIRQRKPLRRDQITDTCRVQLQRVEQIWSTCRDDYADEGPWLFGSLSLADIVFAPVALRLVTYEIPVAGSAASFVSAVQSFEPVIEWSEAAAAEPEVLSFIDDLRPVADTPLIPG